MLASARRSKFVRNVLAVATGVAASQAITLLFMPALTRLYGPEAFGALAAFNAVVNIVMPAATLGYANAIVMAENEEKAAAVARLSLLCSFVVAPVALLIVFLFKHQISEWTGLQSSPNFLYFIPISILILALLSIANQIAIRESLFNAKASSKVVSTLLMNGGKLAGGFLAPTGISLIVLSVIGNALNFFALLFLVPREGLFKIKRWFGKQGVKAAAWKHRDFALFRMPQGIIYSAGLGLPVILLTANFGTEFAGQYSLATLVLGVPITLLGQSVGEVFYPKITSAIHNRSADAWRVMLQTTLLLGVLALIPFGLVIMFGPHLFAMILGEEWYRAGEYARLVAPWLGVTLVSSAVVAAYPALRLQAYFLVQEILSTVARIIAFSVGIRYWGSDLVAVGLFSVVGVVLMVALIAVGFWKLKKDITSWTLIPSPAPSVRQET